MRENLRIAASIMVLAGSILAWVAHQRGNQMEELEASGKMVQGSVIETSANKKTSGLSRNWLRVTYWPEGVEKAITSSFEVTLPFFNKISDGGRIKSHKVEVIYSPKNAQKAIIRGGSPEQGGRFAVAFMLGVSGTGLCLFSLTLFGRRELPANHEALPTELGLEWLTDAVGHAPRDFPLVESIWNTLKSKCSSSAAIDVWAMNRFITGQALWGIRIKVHRDAYDPASKQRAFYGTVLLAPQLSSSIVTTHLLPVAERIWQRSHDFDPGWSDEVEDFMQWVDNDIVHDWEERVVPPEISNGLSCMLTTGLFRQVDMPGRAMGGPLMPLLYSANQKVATLVPPRFWDAGYKARWVLENRQQVQEIRIGKDEADSLAAFEVTGLPPALLRNMESHLEERCAAVKVSCLFLNVGSLEDSDRQEIPGTGELQFLGKFSQYDDILRILEDAIQQVVAPAQRGPIKVRSINLAEFFEKYGWLLDELESRRIDSSD